MTPHMHDCNLR